MSYASQAVRAGASPATLFITLNVDPSEAALAAVRNLFGELTALVSAVGIRDPKADLSCVLGIGETLWQRLDPGAKPAGLHTFQEINGVYRAPSTPADLLLHVRALSHDLCFELTRHIMSRLEGAITVIDETQSFKFFDNRLLIGFVDGAENPIGDELEESIIIGDEDPVFAGGSYVMVQKYLHDLKGWNALPVEEQERIIGRTKLDDIEQDAQHKVSYAHNELTNIADADGNELKILRGNMPFGSPAKGEFGTYFIGYAREPGRMETMLNNMFIGDPPGNHDRLLDFSTAISGALFYAPTPQQLESLAEGEKLGSQAA